MEASIALYVGLSSITEGGCLYGGCYDVYRPLCRAVFHNLAQSAGKLMQILSIALYVGLYSITQYGDGLKIGDSVYRPLCRAVFHNIALTP